MATLNNQRVYHQSNHRSKCTMAMFDYLLTGKYVYTYWE